MESLNLKKLLSRFLFGDVQFVQKIFDTLIDYIQRVVVAFENTLREFYFCMKSFHTGKNFEKLEQERVI